MRFDLMLMRMTSRLDDRTRRLATVNPSDGSQDLYASTMLDVPQSSVLFLRSMPVTHTVRRHGASRGR